MSISGYRMMCDYNGYSMCKCGSKPAMHSYDCEDLGCVLKKGGHGQFKDLHSCQAHCSAKHANSYDCQAIGGYGGAGHVGCVLKHGTEGKYPSLASCKQNCDQAHDAGFHVRF